MDFGMQEIYGTPNKNYLEPILVSNRKDYGSTGEHGAGGLARALVALHQARMEKQGASGQTDTKFEMQDYNSHAASLELQTYPTFFSLNSCVLIV